MENRKEKGTFVAAGRWDVVSQAIPLSSHLSLRTYPHILNSAILNSPDGDYGIWVINGPAFYMRRKQNG